MLKNKKMVRMVALGVTLLFLLGVAGIAFTQSGGSKMALAAGNPSSNIGVVNSNLIFQQHPDVAKVDQQMQGEVDQAKKDFEAKSATMSDKEKQDYYSQTQQRLQLKQQELIAPIRDQIDASIKAVADTKGLTIVLDKSTVVFGGQDITDDVIKKISGK
jgi:outer membrane protein